MRWAGGELRVVARLRKRPCPRTRTRVRVEGRPAAVVPQMAGLQRGIAKSRTTGMCCMFSAPLSFFWMGATSASGS